MKDESASFPKKENNEQQDQELENLIPSADCSENTFNEGTMKLSTDCPERNGVDDQEITPLECSLCKKVFKTKKYLNKHLKIHSGDKPFTCLVCNKSFCESYNLKRHVATHLRATKDQSGILTESNMKDETASFPKKENNQHQDKELENLYPSADGSENTFNEETMTLSTNCPENNGEDNPEITSNECSLCKKVFMTKKYLNRHMKIHSGDKPFICLLCNKRFYEKFNLKRHLETHLRAKEISGALTVDENDKELVNLNLSLTGSENIFKEESEDLNGNCPERDSANHPESKPLECPFCKKLFKKKKYLNNHRKMQSCEKCFTCQLCNRSFPRRYYLKKHMATHLRATKDKSGILTKSAMVVESKMSQKSNNELRDKELNTFGSSVPCFDENPDSPESTFTDGLKSNPLECSFCKKVFKKREHLKEHSQIHSGEKPYPCHLCDKSFVSSRYLKCHVAGHSRTKRFQCELCGVMFRTVDSLKTHLNGHTNTKPYECEVCGESFSGRTGLQKHLRVHTREKPFSCSICDKSFSFKSRFHAHLRSHAGDKPYKCGFCEKAFFDKAHLRSHEARHSVLKPYDCDVCHKQFSCRAYLKVHQRVHTGEKPFKCDICQKRFSQRISLTGHYRVHTGEKPYECNLCNNTYARKGQLDRHKCKKAATIGLIND